MADWKQNFQRLGFGFNHALLLGAAVVIFLILIIPQLNNLVGSLTANADDQKPVLTFEQAQSQVESELDQLFAELDTSNNIQDQQLSLLDRVDDNGQVLGAAIGLGDIPTAEQLFSEQELSQIPVQSVIYTDAQTVQQYADRISRIEGYYDTIEIFAVLNESDPARLREVANQTEAIVNSMRQIPVPDELLNYHRLSSIYYQTLGQIGLGFAGGESGAVNLQIYSKNLFSLIDRIGMVREEINQKYGVKLQ
ncbi:MAG: hypothetical protein R3B41_00565 [Candidatus Doudnabacteria bacterium]